VCRKDEVTNDRIRKTLNRQITLVDVIKPRKLQLSGHICRMSDISPGEDDDVGNNIPQGRPARWLSDDISDWCNCNLTEAVRLASDRRIWQMKVNAITGLNSS